MKMKMILRNREGAVLILVLIVMVAAIIMGVMMTRTSSLESKMAGNERRYITDFANIESAVSLALIQSTGALAAVATTSGNSYTFPDGTLPDGTNLTVTLEDIRKPPVGSGYDPSFRARFYLFEASDDEDNQNLDVGAYKVFPPAQ
ncbi:MAG: hypothetical protein BWZ01_02385 [Deltaproteobacteria bacterium ADurb.BinA179]|nr:MAG: hypothetical protein BWZ01_02385 [Deltaproteobacteria bacterium ADurb.BinA179]